MASKSSTVPSVGSTTTGAHKRNSYNVDLGFGFFPTRIGSKRSKTSNSKRYTTSLNAQSSWQGYNHQLTQIYKKDMENKERYRSSKLRLLEERSRKEILVLEEKLRMMKEDRIDKDLLFFIQPHEHLTGGMLNVMLARKRQLAQIHGWELLKSVRL